MDRVPPLLLIFKQTAPPNQEALGTPRKRHKPSPYPSLVDPHA